jgi:predicted metal-dependent hydrolase
VKFEFNLKDINRSSAEELLELTTAKIPIAFIRNARARRYVLRLRADGSGRVTVPRAGSIAEARKFAERNVAWLERELQRLSTRPVRPKEWTIGTGIFLRGEIVTIEMGVNGEMGLIRFGTETLKVSNAAGDLRRVIERHLWRLAAKEFPRRVCELAGVHHLRVRRVTVRNQKARWGSCSRQGTISLNWRLIQAPQFVRDYLILHELMHLKQMNHSARFWREVACACPDYKVAESWLKQNSTLLR